MIKNTIDEDYEVDENSNVYQPDKSTSPYAVQVEMKKGDPLIDDDSNTLYSDATIGNEELVKNGLLSKKRSNKKRDLTTNPITDSEREKYKYDYLNQYPGNDVATKMQQDAYNKMSKKDIDKAIENNYNNNIYNINKSKWREDVLSYIDDLLEKSNGDSIQAEDYIKDLRNQAKENPKSQAYLYGVDDQLVQDIRNKIKKYNDSVKQLGDSRSYNKLVETNQNVKDTAKATQDKVDTTAKATQDTVKSESKDIQNKIEDIRDDVIKNTTDLDNFYTNYPDLQGYNKDLEYSEAKANTTAAYKQLQDAEKTGDAETYRTLLAHYNDMVMIENAEGARVASSDKYLNGAVSGLKSTQQFTEEAKKDTSWLPKGIIQSYLNGDFGKKAYVQQKDDNGNPMFDLNGKPIYKTHKVLKLDENGKQIVLEQPVLGLDGKPMTDPRSGKPMIEHIPQYEDKPVEKYPSQAKNALGYYLMDTIGNMLTNATAYMPNSKSTPSTSAWKKMQEEKAASYQTAINTGRNAGVTKNAEAVASFGQHNVDVLNKLDDMGIDTSKLRAKKQIDTDQTYELEALANAGTYMNKLDSTTKNALFDAMIMTSDNIDQATAAILKKSYVTGPLKEFINSVITTGGTLLESFSGLINKLNSILPDADKIDTSRAGTAESIKTGIKDATGITKNDIKNYHDNLNYNEAPNVKKTQDKINKEKAKKNPDAKALLRYNKELKSYVDLFNKSLLKYQEAYKSYYGKDPDVSEWSWITGDAE